jgi:hypothetical protein
MITQEISVAQQRPVAIEETSSAAPTPPTSAAGEAPPSVDDDLRAALGLLLKHRGGPGFGHGRLEGGELNDLQTKLRRVAAQLREEASVV